MQHELDKILSKIKTEFICILGDTKQKFATKKEFMESDFDKNCIVDSIKVQDGKVVLCLQQWEMPRTKEQNGLEQSFF